MQMAQVMEERERRGHPVLVSVKADATLKEVACKLNELKIGAMLVREDPPVPGKFAGVISERDIVRACAEGMDFAKSTAKDVMNEQIVCAGYHESILSVARRMKDHHIRHIAVIEEDKIIALLSVRDLMHYADLDREILIRHLSDMVGSHHSNRVF